MTYEKALEIIEAEFETRTNSPVHKTIQTGLTYDGFNGFCLNIYNSANGVILTDLGKTKDIFNEVPQEDWITLCNQHAFEFVHWRITRKFNDINDVYEFIKFLDLISWKYWEE